MTHFSPINPRVPFSIRAARLALALLSLGSSLFVLPAHAATFVEDSNFSLTTGQGLAYVMYGPIVAGDAAKLQGLLNEKKATASKTKVTLHLLGPGGDLEEAFRIGRLLRKYKAYTGYSQCVGNCVYAFMSGSTRVYIPPLSAAMAARHPDADRTGLWVYEPYVMAKVLPMAANNPAIARALKNVKDYTVEMTGDTKFYDAVIKIPHTKPIRISRDDAFGMNVCNQLRQ